jgi:hypothetical protein
VWCGNRGHLVLLAVLYDRPISRPGRLVRITNQPVSMADLPRIWG